MQTFIGQLADVGESSLLSGLIWVQYPLYSPLSPISNEPKRNHIRPPSTTLMFSGCLFSLLPSLPCLQPMTGNLRTGRPSVLSEGVALELFMLPMRRCQPRHPTGQLLCHMPLKGWESQKSKRTFFYKTRQHAFLNYAHLAVVNYPTIDFSRRIYLHPQQIGSPSLARLTLSSIDSCMFSSRHYISPETKIRQQGWS